MRRDKSTFILSSEYESFTNDMTDEEAGILFKAILRHENGGEVGELPPEVKAVWSFIKKRLDNNRAAYEEACRAHAEAGAKGGKSTKRKQMVAKGAKGSNRVLDNDNDNEHENDNDNDNVNNKRFAPPTISEVQAYCLERKNNVNAEQFVDFYTSKGWKVGNNPMKDWKACVRTWERNHRDPQPIVSSTKIHNFQERKYDFASLESRLVQN